MCFTSSQSWVDRKARGGGMRDGMRREDEEKIDKKIWWTNKDDETSEIEKMNRMSIRNVFSHELGREREKPQCIV